MTDNRKNYNVGILTVYTRPKFRKYFSDDSTSIFCRATAVV